MKARAALSQARAVLRMPPPAILFFARAMLRAWRTGDHLSPRSAAHPRELAQLLQAARGAQNVVEIGTGMAWTAIALTVSDSARQVTSLDVWERPERGRYLALLSATDRKRLRLVDRAGEQGPGNLVEGIDFLFIDSSHTKDETLQTFDRWKDVVRPGGVVAFHDYGNADYPGVKEAIEELGLPGEESHLLFVWRKPG
jgi:predicted O-methyltransferase YrrM